MDAVKLSGLRLLKALGSDVCVCVFVSLPLSLSVCLCVCVFCVCCLCVCAVVCVFFWVCVLLEAWPVYLGSKGNQKEDRQFRPFSWVQVPSLESGVPGAGAVGPEVMCRF